VAAEQELRFLRQLRRQRTAKPAWSFFVQQYSGLILQLIREFESDYDEVLDRYLYVCRKLADRKFERFTKFRHGGQKEFSAWLRAVARNLCIDYLREQQGRRRLPRAIARLRKLDRELFEAVYWQGYSAAEAFEDLRATRPEVQFSEVLSSLQRIEASMRPWKFVLMTGTSGQQASEANTGTPEGILAQIPDQRIDPEADVLLREKLRALQREVAELPVSDRFLLRLRFEMGLTLQQTATASGLGDHRKVHERLVRILQQLREKLSGRGWK
jgi:RNA polymerase sigma factor (sigma-70 family)